MKGRDRDKAVCVDLTLVLGRGGGAANGIVTDQPAAGGLSRWLRTADGVWVGVVTYVATLTDGTSLKCADQLLPAPRPAPPLRHLDPQALPDHGRPAARTAPRWSEVLCRPPTSGGSRGGSHSVSHSPTAGSWTVPGGHQPTRARWRSLAGLVRYPPAASHPLYSARAPPAQKQVANGQSLHS